MLVKAPGSTGEKLAKPPFLSSAGGAGTYHVGVKSVDMVRNANGEGGHLGGRRR